MTSNSDLTQSAKEHARDLGEKARTAATDKVNYEAAKLQGRAAHEVQQVADAAEAAANSVDPESMQAQAAHQVASQLEGIAAQIRSTDINTTVRRVSDFARENPALFIGAAAFLGFAATRFLKARSPETQGYVAGGDPWAAAPDPVASPAQAPNLARHPDQDTMAQLERDADHHARRAPAAGGTDA